MTMAMSVVGRASPSLRDVVEGESTLKGYNECCKVGRDVGVAFEDEFTEIPEIRGVNWIVDSSATSSCAGFFW